MTAANPGARNLVVVLTDQERDAGAFEPEGLTEFRNTQLPRRAQLTREGVRFTQHRIASCACVPSRTSMFTGYSPAVHRVRQTDGLAKQADDPAMDWLPPDRVPTLGHRFEAAGFESVYIGKWHLSHADILDVRGRSLPPSGDDSARYGKAERLAAHGFHGWVGPEPHGADPRNTGVARDPGYVAQAQAWLRARARSPERPPFLLVVSLVNPHDMVMWPAWSLWRRAQLELGDIPEIGPAVSEDSIPEHEASVLTAYRAGYASAYGPQKIVEWLYRRDAGSYRRFYASLLRRSDVHLGAVLDTLDETGLAATTHVVFSSDHGELLGAHGGLHQKWYNAFEETLRVPLVIRSPKLADQAGARVTSPSDHLDLVPTLLALAGIDPHFPAKRGEDFERVPPLPGRDLLGSEPTGRSYFVTHDNILAGRSPMAAVGKRFPALGSLLPFRYAPLATQNTAVEAVVAQCSEVGSRSGLYKLVRYFDPLAKTPSAKDEWSLFDLDQDPGELSDLAQDPSCRDLQASLTRVMAEERARLSADGP